MPELAEVALFARDLNKVIGDQKVVKITYPNRSDWGATIIPAEIKSLLDQVRGRQIKFSSAGKALQLYMKKTKAPLVEFRLGMTGQFHMSKKPGVWGRHYFLCLHFEDCTVYYADPRRFGRVIKPRSSDLVLGGYDSSDGLWKQKNLTLPEGYLTKSRISWLLSNGDKTGVGNYMANEALGILKLNPFKPCRNKQEARAILKQCQVIAGRSFKFNGNSFGTGYFILNGEEGSFSQFCKFYGNKSVNKYLFNGRPVFTTFSID